MKSVLEEENRAILRLVDICKDYPMGSGFLRVLNNVSMEVHKGDYLAIMGPSGSGKTTLMNIIGCLDVPTSGELYLNGASVTELTDNGLADLRNREIGFVFQSFNLMPKLTAAENVALPLLYRGVKKPERLERAYAALNLVGLGDRADFTPDRLSGGQSQRVAIARAMVGEPSLLLADEPTGALDSASGQAVMELFAALHEKGSTIIMITHDRKVAGNADKISYILDGSLREGIL